MKNARRVHGSNPGPIQYPQEEELTWHLFWVHLDQVVYIIGLGSIKVGRTKYKIQQKMVKKKQSSILIIQLGHLFVAKVGDILSASQNRSHTLACVVGLGHFSPFFGDICTRAPSNGNSSYLLPFSGNIYVLFIG